MVRIEAMRMVVETAAAAGTAVESAAESAATAPTAGPAGPAGPAPDAVDLNRLGDEIAELAAHMHAVTYRMLVRLAEFDERDGWHGGWRSCAHWLNWRTGIALGASREKVRVARALTALPLLSDAMRRGTLSYSKIRAVTRVANPENETKLLELALTGTAAHVERVVRAWRRVDRLEELRDDAERHERRELTLYVDDDGSYVLRARLDPEGGAVLQRALDAATDVLYRGADGEAAPFRPAAPEPESLDRVHPAQRRADALALVAECALRTPLVPNTRTEPTPAADDDADADADADAAPAVARAAPAVPASPSSPTGKSVPAPARVAGRGDRFLVVLHVDADTLRESSDAGQSVLDGFRIPAETSRRLSCDASVVQMTHGADGSVLNVGRRSRTVTSPIRLAMEHRDGGCRFPGCGVRTGCEAHHARHWADGGETSLANCFNLCRLHHRLVHEGGYRLVVGEDGAPRFYRPDGRLLPDVPAPPALAARPVAALVAAHEEEGLEIGPWTATSRWQGERLDLGFAVMTLRGG